MYREWRRGVVYIGFWWGNSRERDHHLEDTGVDKKIILIRIFRKWNGGTWTGLI
jgi:hypothetical protein